MKKFQLKKIIREVIKEIDFTHKCHQNHRGFMPVISSVDVGKYVLVYKQENTLVKGSRPYDTREEAQKILDLLDDPDVVIKIISC
jgi:hypothetical protein